MRKWKLILLDSLPNNRETDHEMKINNNSERKFNQQVTSYIAMKLN